MMALKRKPGQMGGGHVKHRALLQRLDLVLEKLAELRTLVVGGRVQTQLLKEELVATIQELETEVARNTDVDTSAITLLNGLSTKIQELIDAGANPAQLQQFVDSLRGSSDALAAAVTANTPAAPGARRP